MIFVCTSEYIKASHEQNDLYILAYNIEKNKNDNRCIHESELEDFKAFMAEKRPYITVEVRYGTEEI